MPKKKPELRKKKERTSGIKGDRFEAKSYFKKIMNIEGVGKKKTKDVLSEM